MDVLPSIDLRDGKVVRLSQGDYDRQTVYGDDPLAVAEQFVAAGARWIHMVDLDAARTGEVFSLSVLQSLAESLDVRIEFGGGVRDEETVERLLDIGIQRLVIGSAALKDWPWFEKLCRKKNLARRIALGLDARGGRLAIHGWTERVEATAVEVARRVSDWPLGAIVHTDIARDGMLTGTNLEATAQVVAAGNVPVIASGGVASIEDVRGCRETGCSGVIIGRAWYEGRIDLVEAIEVAGGP